MTTLVLLLALLMPGQETLTEAQIKDLIRKSADNDVENTKRQRDYTYIQRNEERKLDRNGRVKSVESKTYEIMVLSGEPERRLIAKNDKPLSEKEARKEEERIQKLVAKYGRESENDRRKRRAKTDKETEEGRQFVREIADAYRFRLVSVEDIAGRPAYKISADPVPGYKPKLKDAKILPKLRFNIWIDKADTQWVKIDAECIDTISWGLFLARLHKGSTMEIEQTRVNDEVWLPRHFGLKMDAKVVLFKNLDMEIDVTFRDYKKFVAETTITPIGEF